MVKTSEEHEREVAELMSEIEVAYARFATAELEGAEWKKTAEALQAEIDKIRLQFIVEKSSAMDAASASHELALADALIAQEEQLLAERYELNSDLV